MKDIKTIFLSFIGKHISANHRIKERKKLTGVICDVCGFKAMGPGHLITHKASKRCTREKDAFRCDMCDYKSNDIYLLNKHIKGVHEKEPCAICGKIIAKCRMTIHINIFHTEDKKKRFPCSVCGKGFVDKKSFREHFNTHTGERPFKCDLCEKTFASSGNMYQHRKSSHYGIKRTK